MREFPRLRKFKPKFHTCIAHAINDGNFWLAVGVALTALGPNLDKPYSGICYGFVAFSAIYGAALKSSQDHYGDEDAR